MRTSLAVALIVLVSTGAVAPFQPGHVSATGGDNTGHPIRDLGNPCGALGAPGGLASDAAGKLLYYSTSNQTPIYRYNLVTGVCTKYASGPTEATSWSSLAWDPVRKVLWGAKDDGSGALHRITLPATCTTCTYVATKWLTHAATPGFAANLHGIAVIGNDLYVSAFGEPIVARYLGAAAAATPPVTLSKTVIDPQGTVFGVKALAAFGGALWIADVTGTIYEYAPGGLGPLLAIRPHSGPHHGWFHEIYELDLRYFEIAFDAVFFATGAMWIVDRDDTNYRYCVRDCPVYDCVEWQRDEDGNLRCIRTECRAPCPPGEWVTVQRTVPHLYALQFPKAPCAGPDFTCPCPAPAPTFTFLSPKSEVYVQGKPQGPAPHAVAYRGPLDVEVETANAKSPRLWLKLDGADLLRVDAPRVTHTFAATDGIWAQRGFHTLQAVLLDRASACYAFSSVVRFWVDDPTLWTHAQSLRLEGNVPLNLAAGTLAMAPANDLVGREREEVADLATPPPLGLHAEGLEAIADHGFRPNALELDAVATTRSDRLALDLDLAALCALVTTGNPSCATLPHITEDAAGMRAEVRVHVKPLATSFASSTTFVFHEDPLLPPQCSPATGQDSILPAIPGTPTRLSGCELRVGNFRVDLYTSRHSRGPLWEERTFVPLRVSIDDGPFRGELVYGEVYAGISLAGRGVLEGPPHFLDDQDDFGTNADVASTPPLGPLVGEGLWSGMMRGADRADAFRVWADPGQKLKIVVQPGHREAAYVNPLPTLPTVQEAPRAFQVTLLDPSGKIRDLSTVATVAPQVQTAEVELNVDVGGPWGVLVERKDSLVERSTYSVLVERPQAPPLLGSDALSGGDAPATCGAALALPRPGIHAGSMGVGDDTDFYAIALSSSAPSPAARFAFSVTGPDLDGADFDLLVWNAPCTTLLGSASLGKPSASPNAPKGTTDAVVLDLGASPPTAFKVQVVRANGIGNYVLEVARVAPA